jgi:hypothetical protein
MALVVSEENIVFFVARATATRDGSAEKTVLSGKVMPSQRR